MAKKKAVPPTDEELANPRTPEQFRLGLRRKVRLYYDVQRLRMQAAGRLTRKAEGAQIDLHPKDKEKIAARVHDLELAEKNALADVTEQLHEVPFYRDVIEPKRKTQYRGLGPRMAGIIVSSFDIEREDTVSQMWSFAGLAPLAAQRCKQCNIVVTPQEESVSNGLPGAYKHSKPAGNKCKFAANLMDASETYPSGKAMRPVAGEKLKYNAWLKTKLLGVLAPVLLKVGSPYKAVYDGYKLRWQNEGKGISDGHRHQAAMRYMIKMLLVDIHKEWRTHAGLPVRLSYHEEKLHHVHHPNRTSNDTHSSRVSQHLFDTRGGDANRTPDEDQSQDVIQEEKSFDDLLIEEIARDESIDAAE